MSDHKPNWYETLQSLIQSEAIPTLHRILLYGPPGTGKSAAARFLFNRDVERVTLHESMPPEDLIGAYSLRADQGGTSTEWTDGPAIRAMRSGSPLVLDEIDAHSPEVRCALHALLDDRAQARVLLPTGESVAPAPGFVVVATSNATPSALPEALLDRFDLVLRASHPAPGILEALPTAYRAALTRDYDERSHREAQRDQWSATISVRRMQALAALMQHIDDTDRAIALVFGASAPDISTILAAHRAGSES